MAGRHHTCLERADAYQEKTISLGDAEVLVENSIWIGIEEDLNAVWVVNQELCRQYDDALVLFQVGDFYEAFCAAAKRVAGCVRSR